MFLVFLSDSKQLNECWDYNLQFVDWNRLSKMNREVFSILLRLANVRTTLDENNEDNKTNSHDFWNSNKCRNKCNDKSDTAICIKELK